MLSLNQVKQHIEDISGIHPVYDDMSILYPDLNQHFLEECQEGLVHFVGVKATCDIWSHSSGLPNALNVFVRILANYAIYSF